MAKKTSKIAKRAIPKKAAKPKPLIVKKAAPKKVPKPAKPEKKPVFKPAAKPKAIKPAPPKPIPKKMAKPPAKAKPPKQKGIGIDTAKIAVALDEAQKAEKKTTEKLIPTGIPGLDKMLGGGYEKGAVVVVTGGPGTGKTTMGLQFLYNGATEYDEGGMYITFEEQKETILRHVGKFGWNFASLEKNKKLVFIEYPPHEVDRFLSEGGIIEDMIHEYKIKRIVIDSMTTFLALYDSDYRRRQAFLKMMETLRKWGCTAVLTCEGDVSPDGEIRTHFGIEFLSDGLIAMHSIHKGEVVEIAMEVVKMRGIAYEHRLVPVRFTASGIAAYPAQHVFAKERGV